MKQISIYILLPTICNNKIFDKTIFASKVTLNNGDKDQSNSSTEIAEFNEKQSQDP